MSRFFDSLSGFALGAAFILMVIGELYWLFISLQIGSFWMFLLGIFPITAFFLGGPVGAWSLVFGVPNWIYSLFA